MIKRKWNDFALGIGLTEQVREETFMGWMAGPHLERERNMDDSVREAGCRLIDELWVEAKADVVEYTEPLKDACSGHLGHPRADQ